ncbi:hypothetical protein Naga_100003g49 [Nannochloropsis gaditana]|uniref:Uncharacterized protein n=1 Tax=Nannochloropsis gaditana TaxID=72520 RepID=W7UBW2_9STRA|nr:hypothetical protein Naga_100003g49 [Nannochloropsis gaditana]
MRALSVGLILATIVGAAAFVVPPLSLPSRDFKIRLSAGGNEDCGTSLERRSALHNSLCQAVTLSMFMFGGATWISAPSQAMAAVGEGGLPAVTEAFQRVIRGQREWNKVGKTIADREGKLADEEWVNTQIFLRNSYMVGEDMRRIVRDAEESKREKGTAIAKDFQRLTLDMDKPTKSKDFQGFIEAQKKGASYFQDFIDLLSDVPDEL